MMDKDNTRTQDEGISSKEALDRIRQAEALSRKTLEDAAKEAHEILAASRGERERIIRDSHEKARAEIKAFKANIEKEGASGAAAIEKDAREEARRLEAKAKENLAKAVDFIKAKHSSK